MFSATFLVVSVVSVPLGVSPYVTLTLGIVGAVGFAIKEALGSAAPSDTTTPSTTPNSAVLATTAQPEQPDPTATAQLKAIGDIVYSNPNYTDGLVYKYLGEWYDVYGNDLGSSPPAGTGTVPL